MTSNYQFVAKAVLTAVQLAIVLVLVPAGRADAAFPGTNGKIAFSSNRDGNREIYVMYADGYGQTRLTNNVANDIQPAWAPNGNRVAFTSDRDGHRQIYAMNANGTGQVRRTTNAANDSEPAWSPDGNRLAFTSDRDGNSEIYVMNADGSGQLRLTANAANDGEPAWSTDGTQIAFTSDRDGNDEIYVMNSGGSSPTRLTDNPAKDRQPAWSPNGARIAFASDRDGNDEIYVMNANGSDPARLAGVAANDSDLAWSPDGSRIAFTSNRDGNDEIYAMNANGSEPSNLSNNGAVDVEPDWQRAPANDDRTMAQVVGQGQYTGTLAGATPDGTTNCPGTGQPDIWFLFTAPAAGTLQADTCGTNDLGGVDSGTDTVLSLQSGAGPTELACGDDWPGGIPSCPAASGSLYDSHVQAPVVGGQQIWIRVSKYPSSGPAKDILLNVAFEPDPDSDTDQDGVVDGSDNCTLVANPTQLDANHDGFGNICDADLNNSGNTTSNDYTIMKSVLLQSAGSSPTAAAADLNGSGTVTSNDYTILKNRLLTAPGPSGLACAGTIPCP